MPQYFIPWMQATYLMVARRDALKYLPKQAQLDHLSYDQFIDWAANIHAATGTPKLGFSSRQSGSFPPLYSRIPVSVFLPAE